MSSIILCEHSKPCSNCEIERLKKQVTSLQTLNTELTLKNRSSWLPTIQQEHAEWNSKQPWANKSKNAGVPLYFEPLLGIGEEAGELKHCFLKLYQGIRGTEEEHIANGKDACGDIIIYMIHLCNVMGWDLQSIIHDTWNGVVKKRNWSDNKITGEATLVFIPETIHGLDEPIPVKIEPLTRKALHHFTQNHTPICCTRQFNDTHFHPIKMSQNCTTCGCLYHEGDHIDGTTNDNYGTDYGAHVAIDKK